MLEILKSIGIAVMIVGVISLLVVATLFIVGFLISILGVDIAIPTFILLGFIALISIIVHKERTYWK